MLRGLAVRSVEDDDEPDEEPPVGRAVAVLREEAELPPLELLRLEVIDWADVIVRPSPMRVGCPDERGGVLARLRSLLLSRVLVERPELPRLSRSRLLSRVEPESRV